MGDFHLAVDGPHLVEGLDLGREAAVDAEDLSGDQGSQGQVVEGIVEVLPGGGAAVLLDDLVVEAVDSSDLPGLVVAPEQDDVLGVLDLVAEEQLDGLDGVVAPVDEIPDEYVLVGGQLAPHLEELKHVEELPVDVPADCYGGLGLVNVALLEEKLLHLVAERTNSSLLQVLAALELGDPLVDFSHLKMILLKITISSHCLDPALPPHHAVGSSPRLLVHPLSLQHAPPPHSPAYALALPVEKLSVPLPNSPLIVPPVNAPIFPVELSVAVLEAMVERAGVPSFGSGEDSLPLEDILLKGPLVDISRVFESANLLGPVLVLSSEKVVGALLFALPVKDVVLEKSSIDDVVCHVKALSISPSVLHLALVVVSIGVDEPAVAVGEAISEGAFVYSS